MTAQINSVSNLVHFDQGKGAGAETAEPGGDQEDQSLAQEDPQGDEGSQDDYSACKEQQDDHHHHSLQLQHHPQGADKAVTPACTDRMPGPKVQASPGGSCARTPSVSPCPNVESVKVTENEEERTPMYVKGATEAENKAYKEFLEYMEEKRKDAKDILEAEGERKARASRKEKRWQLLRESLKFLEENTEGWKTR